MKYNETYLGRTLNLGRIEQMDRTGEPLTPEERAVLDAANPRERMEAARAYVEHLEQIVRLHGGTIITERSGWRDGEQFSERTVETFPPLMNGNGGNGRTNSRPRGAGRPRAKAGSRSSGSSSDDPDEPEPPRRRLCAFCKRDIPPERATQARYCSDKHAEVARKRRTRDRQRSLRVGQPAIGCRCNGRHMIFADWPGHCIRCGRGDKAVIV
jgi:hypothetical protein